MTTAELKVVAEVLMLYAKAEALHALALRIRREVGLRDEGRAELKAEAFDETMRHVERELFA